MSSISISFLIQLSKITLNSLTHPLTNITLVTSRHWDPLLFFFIYRLYICVISFIIYATKMSYLMLQVVPLPCTQIVKMIHFNRWSGEEYWTTCMPFKLQNYPDIRCVCMSYPSTLKILCVIPGKKLKTTATKKFPCRFPLIMGLLWQFCVAFGRFASLLAQ